MTFDDHFRDQISRGQPPLIALHNAAQAYAESLKPRDCSQYADETAAWSEQGNQLTPLLPVDADSARLTKMVIRRHDIGEPFRSLERGCYRLHSSDESIEIIRDLDQSNDIEAVELLREMLQFCDRLSTGTHQMFDVYGWSHRVRNFLEGKQ